MSLKKRMILELTELIIQYSNGEVLRPVAEAEAVAYFKRRGIFYNPFIHGGAISGIAKKLAYKCMGTPIV